MSLSLELLEHLSNRWHMTSCWPALVNTVATCAKKTCAAKRENIQTELESLVAVLGLLTETVQAKLQDKHVNRDVHLNYQRTCKAGLPLRLPPMLNGRHMNHSTRTHEKTGENPGPCLWLNDIFCISGTVSNVTGSCQQPGGRNLSHS